jgi:hypothetical protein
MRICATAFWLGRGSVISAVPALAQDAALAPATVQPAQPTGLASPEAQVPARLGSPA